MRTIYVDDESWMLKQFCYDIEDVSDIELIGAFRSPLAALEFAKSQLIELAFLDVEMPEMNGLSLASELRKIYPKMIIIFISAYENYVARAILGGADYFVMKPYSKQDLESVISRVRLLSGRLKKQIMIRTFGNFDLFINQLPVSFPDEKSKELLALLTDHCGGLVVPGRAASILFPGLPEAEQVLKFDQALMNLKKVLSDASISNLLTTNEQGIYLRTDIADCDYMMYLDSNVKTMRHFRGSYMDGYEWAETTRSTLLQQQMLLMKSKDVLDDNTVCASVSYKSNDAMTILHMNDSFLSITGFCRDEIRSLFGSSLRALINRDDFALLKAASSSDTSSILQRSYRLKTKSGKLIWIMENRKLRDYHPELPGSGIYDSILMDISDLKSRQTELEETAQRDGLTGLYNRSAALQLIEQYLNQNSNQEQSQNNTAAIVLMDIDNFKHVNDTYGHPFADTVLTDIASILKRSVRSTDIVSRIGGDEMLLFLEKTPDAASVKMIMEKILKAVNDRMGHKTPDGEITCSFGIALYPGDAKDFHSLYECADKALYDAKKAGKNRIAFYDGNRA